MKKFRKEFHQNREQTALFRSPKHKFGEYNWALGAQVRKHDFLTNEFYLATFLQCDSADQSQFPFQAHVKFGVLNQDRDLRKTQSKGKNDSWEYEK